MRERRRMYELVIIASPIVANEEGITAMIERMSGAITGAEGEVLSVNHSSPWGRRKLAYPIRSYVTGEASRRSFSEGYYILFTFTLGAARVSDIERTIKLTDTILRHLITQVEQKGVSELVESVVETDSEAGE